MTQFIMLRNYSIHVPSFARARLLPTFFLRRPQIYLEGYQGYAVEVNYPISSWDTAKKDYKKLLDAMDSCNQALGTVPKISVDLKETSVQKKDELR